MLATYMWRMRNDNLEVKIVGSYCHPQISPGIFLSRMGRICFLIKILWSFSIFLWPLNLLLQRDILEEIILVAGDS